MHVGVQRFLIDPGGILQIRKPETAELPDSFPDYLAAFRPTGVGAEVYRLARHQLHPPFRRFAAVDGTVSPGGQVHLVGAVAQGLLAD